MMVSKQSPRRSSGKTSKQTGNASGANKKTAVNVTRKIKAVAKKAATVASNINGGIGWLSNAAWIYAIYLSAEHADPNHPVIQQILKHMGLQFLQASKPLREQAENGPVELAHVAAVQDLLKLIESYGSAAKALGMRSNAIVAAIDELSSVEAMSLASELQEAILSILKDANGNLTAAVTSSIEFQILQHVMLDKTGGKRAKPRARL